MPASEAQIGLSRRSRLNRPPGELAFLSSDKLFPVCLEFGFEFVLVPADRGISKASLLITTIHPIAFEGKPCVKMVPKLDL